MLTNVSELTLFTLWPDLSLLGLRELVPSSVSKAVSTLQSKSSQLVEYETKVTVKIQLQHCTTIHQLLMILLVQRGLLSDKVPFPNQLLGSSNFPSYIELVRHVAAICLPPD